MRGEVKTGLRYVNVGETCSWNVDILIDIPGEYSGALLIGMDVNWEEDM